MKQDQTDIRKFYDEFAAAQLENGVNERLYACFKRLKKLGIAKAEKVLELGCGVGSFTGLLQSVLPAGAIEAVDLSPASIELAKNRIGASARFTAADILRYQPLAPQFDFIILLDVIEHIPLELHEELWKHYTPKLKTGGRLVINLPNPAYLEWEQTQKPEQLQILDQPVPVDQLLRQLFQAGLALYQFETYTIWSENDYHFIVFEKATAYEEKLIRRSAPVWTKMQLKAHHYWLKWRYRS